MHHERSVVVEVQPNPSRCDPCSRHSGLTNFNATPKCVCVHMYVCVCARVCVVIHTVEGTEYLAPSPTHMVESQDVKY